MAVFYTVPGGAPYGVFPASAAGQLYAPPPSYDQALAAHHPPINLGQQMYSPAAAMYAAASYPGYIGYPVQYYPYYSASAAAAAMQPSIQPLRPTIMIPVK